MFIRFRLRHWYQDSIYPRWDRLIHFRKCSCGHPLHYHQCYEHGTCIHGVCLASSFTTDICVCDGFNSIWNKQYPPNKPELRITSATRCNEEK
mgnify:FL=1